MRSNAAESLGFFSKEASQSIPVLLPRLSDDKVEVRRSVIQSLGRLGKGNHDVEQAVVKFLDDPDKLIKLNAIVALAAVGKPDDSVIPTLLEAIGNKDEATAKAAGLVLTELAKEKPDKVLPGLMDSLDQNKEPGVVNSLKVLRLMKAGAVPAIPKISALYDKSDAQTRTEILQALASIDGDGGQALPVLAKALKAPEPMVRKEALMQINRYRAKSDLFLDPLIESLNDGDVENRLTAIGTLRSLGQKGQKAIPALEKLTQDPEVRVRSFAINALAGFRPPPDDVLETLGRTLKDSDLEVKLSTVGALRQLGYAYPDKVIGLLQSALQDEKNEQARRAMAATLAGISKVKPSASAAGSDQPGTSSPQYTGPEQPGKLGPKYTGSEQSGKMRPKYR